MTQMRIKAGELAQIINIHLAEKGCKWASARTVEQFASGYIEFRGVKGEAMGRMDFRLEPGTEYIEDFAALNVQAIRRLILANHVSDVLQATRTEGGAR